MIEAIIFDMDGLLIDSEPYWRDAEPEVLHKVGVPLTPEMCFQTTGLRIDEVVAYWHRRHPWDLQAFSITELSEAIIDGVIHRVREHGEPLPGVLQSIDFFREKKLPLAVASSSAERLIAAVLDVLKLKHHFQVIHSAEHEAYGKPHPAVFLHTARELKAHPDRCLVLEDSLNGVIAAKAARMKCIAVPDAFHREDPRFVLADIILDSLEAFDETVWNDVNKGQ